MEQSNSSPPPKSPLMKNRLLIGFAILFVVATMILVSRNKKKTPFELIQQQVAVDLPVGTSKDDLQKWANEHFYPISFRKYEMLTLPPAPAKTLPEISGLPRGDLGSFAEILIDWGSYKLWRTDETVNNKLWIFITMDEDDRVKGTYFLTLEQLAEHERQRESNNKSAEK